MPVFFLCLSFYDIWREKTTGLLDPTSERCRVKQKICFMDIQSSFRKYHCMLLDRNVNVQTAAALVRTGEEETALMTFPTQNKSVK